MTLGQRIQELRKQAGLSQEGLGEALGVSRQAVSKWESDGGIPELDTLIAMSRMFGITVGQLLGVEEPREEEAAQPSVNEELVEAVLRRYAEESRRPAESEQPPKYPIGSWIVAGCAVVLAVVMLIVGVGKVRGVFSTVSNLQSQISTLQSDLNSVSSQVSNISGNLREQVEQALEEGNRMLSTFNWNMVSFDPKEQTVTLRFNATLKDYSAGSTMQIHTYWIKTDRTEGQTDSEWVKGPSFSGEITVPMNFHTEVSVRVKDSSGNVREQSGVDVIYSLHPDSFELEAYNIIRPVKLRIIRYFQDYVTGYADNIAFLEIVSGYPEEVWPERAVIAAYVNDALVMETELTLTSGEDERTFEGRIADREAHGVKLNEGDELVVVVTVTDNLGRVKEFTHGGSVRNGNWIEMPMSAPAVRPD